jgi:hypothetical protein
MDHPARMCCRQNVEQLIDDVENEIELQPSAAALSQRGERLAREQLHDEIGRARVVDPVVIDLNDALMADAVGNIGFAQEALALALGISEPRVHQFECDALAIAMRGLVHGRHAADPEQSPQSIFVREWLSDASLGNVPSFPCLDHPSAALPGQF